MNKEEFLKIIEDNVRDYNKKVKFIFINPYIKIECYLTSARYPHPDNIELANYSTPVLDAKRHSIRGMVELITEFSGMYVSFYIYLDENRPYSNRHIAFYNYTMVVNETYDSIELLISE